MAKKNTGASLVVDTLINLEVKHVFTIPGAKIDKILDEFNNRSNAPRLIVSRHEQNATFMAQGIGRITNRPGVVLVTSGPGVSNLATGLVTATAESDPLLAIGGNVRRKDSLKRTHQSMNNVSLMEPVTKYAKEILSADSVSEGVVNAYREALGSRKGATFLSIPQDVSIEETESVPLKPRFLEKMGGAPLIKIQILVDEIEKAKFPVLLLGMRSSDDRCVKAIRGLLEKIKLPVVETFQGAGIIPRNLEETFFGRVGIFKNQPGDLLLDKADLVIAIGYDPIEYDPEIWNKDSSKKIFHIDEVVADIDKKYIPFSELPGDIARTVRKLTDLLGESTYALSPENQKFLKELKTKFESINKLFNYNPEIVHPLQLMQALRLIIDDPTFTYVDDFTTITVDVGSLYIWMARNFKSYEPRKLLFSNGMQTLGVALPWAIAASILDPTKKVVSMSGDGGFLFSGQELDTAVKEKCNITHIIWDDSSYNMVAFQQEMKYGRATTTELGDVDFVKYAEAFGAKGFKIDHPSQLDSVLREALAYQGVALVDVTIDYSENIILGKMLIEEM